MGFSTFAARIMIARALHIALFCLWNVIAFAQVPSIEFSEVVHDFGLIRETGGPVFHDFYFHNTGAAPVVVDTVEASCGCTVPLFQKNDIAPGDSSFIRIQYHPAGRPGEFTKSANVIVRQGETTAHRYVNIRGRVIGEELESTLPANMQTRDAVLYNIEVAPYSHQLACSPKPVILANNSFNTFINDLTYIIDQDGFVNLEMVAPTYENRSKRDTLLERQLNEVAAAVENAFLYRGYEAFQVAFKIRLQHRLPSDFPKAATDTRNITLRASDYGNDELSTSIIEEKKATIPNEPIEKAVDTIFFEPHLAGYYRSDLTKGKPKLGGAQYESFVKNSVRELLMTQHLLLQLKVVLTVNEPELEKAKTRGNTAATAVQKQLLKDFAKEGIDAEQITWLSPVVKVYAVNQLDTAHNFLQISRKFFVEEPKEEALATTAEAQQGEVPENPPIASSKSLPVSMTFINERYARVDTTGIGFVTMINRVIPELRAGKPISFLIESSASHSPTRLKVDNEYVARLRANESMDMIRHYLQQRGIQDSLIQFEDPICLVQGPEFLTRYYPLSYYEQFQYLKVIPVYRSNYVIAHPEQLTPYMINFEYKLFELETNSPVYQVFIRKLIPIIQAQGYVTLIIESSASQVPTRDYRDNRVLAFNRAEDAREKLYSTLVEYGVDPQRLIIIEQRALVQGPDYDPDLYDDLSVYAPFQYIKLIPGAFVGQ